MQHANAWLDNRAIEQSLYEQNYFPDYLNKSKEGKQRDGIPKTNGPQNDQYADAVKEIERKIGKKLTEKQIRNLHDEISGKNYGYHDIVDEGYWMFYD